MPLKISEMMKTSWHNVNVPEPLYQEIVKLLNTQNTGFESPSEFIRHAIREKLDQEYEQLKIRKK
jgi:metal-responsive CopG/Arc/MetJ family transcriptional regulator